MIVVDTNIISYLLLPTSYSDSADALYKFDADWVLPSLWKSEFRNVLAVCVRQGVIPFEKALQFQTMAENLLKDHEYNAPSTHVLSLVSKSSCSAYDCEFIALAQYFDIQLVTQNKQILEDFSGLSVSMADFIRQKFTEKLG